MQQPGQNNLSFWQRAENTQWWMRYPAMTLMVFLRRDIGYRLLEPKDLLPVTGVLAVLGILIPPSNPQARPENLFWFSVISLFFGAAQRGKRWKELQRGSVQHSYYIGTSPFDYRWLPEFLRKDRRMARIFDPFVCAAIGVWIWHTSIVLGYYLMFAAICLRGYEHAVHRKEQNQSLDLMDNLITSQIHSKTVEAFEEPAQAQPQQPSPGIPTGVAPDIQEHINRRKAK